MRVSVARRLRAKRLTYSACRYAVGAEERHLNLELLPQCRSLRPRYSLRRADSERCPIGQLPATQCKEQLSLRQLKHRTIADPSNTRVLAGATRMERSASMRSTGLVLGSSGILNRQKRASKGMPTLFHRSWIRRSSPIPPPSRSLRKLSTALPAGLSSGYSRLATMPTRAANIS